MKKQTITALTVLAALALSLAGCGKTQNSSDAADAQSAETEAKAFPVRVATVTTGTIESYRSFGGDVVAAHTKAILPTTSGEVKELPIEEGDVVKKGQVVAILDQSKPGLNYKPSEVYAPIDGTVLQVDGQIGQQASPATSLGTVASTDDLEIHFDVAERLLYAVQKDDKVSVTFDAYPDETFTATITKLGATLDTASRTRRITCVLDTPDDRIIPGMYARIKVLVDRADDAVIIPRSAVTSGHVFVLNGEGDSATVSQRDVTIGIQAEGNDQITEGLSAGETIVIEGLAQLSDGSRVSVLQ